MNRITVLGSFSAALVALSLLAACPAGSSLPSKDGLPSKEGLPSTSTGKVDPNTCGNYAVSDAGRKLKAFLEATVQLEAAVTTNENYLRETCAIMGRELGMADSDMSGDTKTTCNAVAASLKEHMKVGVKAGARLDVQYKPAVCTVNVEAAAKATAQCEARAEADIAVRCEGSCSGTCNGTCSGKCAGKAGTGGSAGQCNGRCEGSCQGSCSGGCEGHADVDASASCKAKAEVSCNVEAQCTEPEVKVAFKAGVVVDKSKVDQAVAAIKAGLPRILQVRAKAAGPIKAAFTTWATAATELSKAGRDLTQSFGEQALCVSGQIAAAANMLTRVEASVSVQVEVSAEVSGSAGAGA